MQDDNHSTPPPVPDSLPPVPPGQPTRPTAPARPTPYATYFPKAKKPQGPPTDPSWWRSGWIPLAVLVMAAIACDLLCPCLTDGMPELTLGLGAAIGSAVYLAAIMLLRRDISRSERIFLIAMGVIGIVALIMSGSGLAWMVLVFAPFILLSCFGVEEELPEIDPKANYRTWWQYWTARRKDAHEKRNWRAILPTLLSVVVGIVLFVAFLGIFASGNPVVQLVWETICRWWNDLLEFLDLDWDFWLHVIRWVCGVLLFGFLTLRRWHRGPKTAAMPAAPKAEGTTLLPHLPLMSLIGINLAFLVATSTDIAFLWFGNVPEGISQTTYLHDGASSIIWASILAAGVLIFLFRRNGSARETAPCRFLGLLLAAQTFLLALSVYVRLYHQIADFGFTWTRIMAGEFLLLGLAGLIILVVYIVRSGKLMRYAKTCLATMALMVFAFTAIPPGYLAGSLNLAYMDSHPHWKFSTADFMYRVDIEDNIEFAWRVLERHKQSGASEQDNIDHLQLRIANAADDAIARGNSHRWTIWNRKDAKNYDAALRFREKYPNTNR